MPAGRGMGAVLPWAMVVLGIVALVVAAVLLWPDGERAGARGDPGTGTEPTSPAAPVTSSPGDQGPPRAGRPEAGAPSGATSEGATGAASEGTTGAAPTKSTPPAPEPDRPTQSGTSGTPVITSSVRAGDDCTVLERGLVVTGADGQRLTCVEDGAGQAWTAGG